MPSSSKIFTGFRALGFTSNHVPLAMRYSQQRKENYVVTSIGKAFHTYNCSRLGISSVSESLEEPITCLATNAYLVFAASSNVIKAFSRGKHVKHEYIGHEATVHLLLPFGNHLISVDEKSQVKVWDIISEEVYTEVCFDNNTFHVTTVVHPSTYVNKVIFGSRQGSLQLWNLRSNKLVFTFSGWGTPITALEQAPAMDVVAVGLEDGRIMIHNLKYDETLMNFRQDWGPITAITFRTDGHPIMVTGSTVGHIALWNLQEKKLQTQMRAAHDGVVSGLRCLPSEPLLISSGGDNSLKVWIFDMPDGGGRLLRQRLGHSAPPNKISFQDKRGEVILSAGQDSTLQSFSTVHDGYNRSLGRASFNKKKSKKVGLKRDEHMMPPITDFFSESSRQSDWDGIAACHRGLKEVTTWTIHRFTMGAHRLLAKRFTDTKTYPSVTAQCVTVTSCGNFAVVGYSTGHVDVFNMQSGLHRGAYGDEEQPAHTGSVRGVAVDGLNQVTVTSGADSCVNFWRFKKRSLIETVKVPSQVARILLHRESAMLAVATDDFCVSIFDVDTRKVIRKFSNHQSLITDMTFSPDARWLITSSLDCCTRTWDLPTGSLVDCFTTSSAVTSLTFSPLGEYLATTHIDDLGIYLWSNMTLYTHVALRPLPEDYEPQILQTPSTSRISQGLRTEEDEEDDEDEGLLTNFKSPEQISDELVTLSLLPDSRWKNLLSLDIIKMRNKPKEPPKVPKAAPFFLPTVAGLEPKFVQIEEDKESEKSKKFQTFGMASLTKFGRLLSDTFKNKNFEPVRDAMKEMGPSHIDLEIRSLSPEAGGSVDLMLQFMCFIDYMLLTNRDFELAQGYLGLFIKLHGDAIAAEPDLTEQAKILQVSQAKAWTDIQELFNQNLCLVNYLRSATL